MNDAPVPATATLEIDGEPVPFAHGDSVLRAALAAGHWIPHLCHDPAFGPHGSCRLCTVTVDGRHVAACTVPAAAGQVVKNRTPELAELRRTLIEMLFAEGNHFCPSCEKSGDCRLQALGRELGVLTAGFRYLFPDRPVDASHPELLLDFNRCVFCELCVRASDELDRKAVFALSGRGIGKTLVVDSPSGRLGDSAIDAADRAASICPVGAILHKGRGFEVPIGQRRFDRAGIRDTELAEREGGPHG